MDAELHRGLTVLAGAIQIAVGLILLSGGLGKMRRWHSFQAILGAYEILPAALVAPIAFALVPVELLIGVSVLLGWNIPVSTGAAAGLLAIYAIAMAINIARGRTSIDCGCFQSIRQPVEGRLVARNLLCSCALLASGVFADFEVAERALYALPAGLTLFVLYLGLSTVWALDASRIAAFSRN